MATTGPQPLQENLTHLGGFEILEMVGQGGMGRVYRARQLSLDRVVALKVLTPQLAADPKYTDSFLREARSAARLQHPNIVSVFDAGKADGHFYYAMEFVRGETLDKWVRRDGALPESTALGVGICIANALKHAWDKEKIMHRDVKPENVMVDTDGNVKLCDLGLAKNFGENTQLSLSGQVFGTPQYMSPEQSRADAVDFRTDIYSLGMTIYFALTAEIPFHGGTPGIIMARHMTEQLADPRHFNPQISAHTCRVLEKMLAKDAANRYPSWNDALRDMELALAGQPPLAQPPPANQSSLRLNPSFNVAAAAAASPVRVGTAAATPKSKTPLAIAAAVAILLLAGGAIYFISTTPPSSPPNPPASNPPNVAAHPPAKAPRQQQQQNPTAQNPVQQPPPAPVTAAQRLAEAQAFAMTNPLAREEFLQRLRALIAEFPDSPEANTAKQLIGEPTTTPAPPADAVAHAQAVRAFYKFKADYFEALAHRNYAEAETLARAAMRQPELAPMRAAVEDTIAIPQRVEAFFKSFPAHFGKLKGRSFRAADGNSGVLVDVQEAQLVWNWQVGGVFTLPVPIPMPWRDLKNPDAMTLAVAAFGDGGADDQLNLAWFAFSIGLFENAMARLEQARALGANIAEAQRVMNLLGKPQETDAQTVFAAAQQLADQKLWAQARELTAFLKDKLAATSFVATKEAEIAKLDAQIAEFDLAARRALEETERQRQREAQQLIEQREREARAQAAADQAFADFGKSFLALLSRREYADAVKLARSHAASSDSEPLKLNYQRCAAAAETLQNFWSALVTNAATFKGKELTLQGVTGTLAEINDTELLLERKIGESGVVGEPVAWRKLSIDEALSFAPSAAQQPLALAWFQFAEGNVTAAHAQLTKLPASDNAATEARQLMSLLQQGPLEESARKLIADLRRSMDAQKWAEARVTLQVLRESYPTTRAVQSLATELAGWEKLIREGERVSQTPAGAELRTFAGHKDHVLSVTFSPDGRFLLSASRDKTAKLWETATGQEAHSYKEAVKWWGGSIPVAFTPDSRFFVIGNNEKILRLIDVTTSRELWSVEPNIGEIYALNISPDGKLIALGGSEKSCQVRFTADGKQARSYEGVESKVRAIAFSPDGRTLRAGTENRTIHVWDVATGRALQSFSDRSGWWRDLAFSRDGKLAVAASDRELRLFETSSGQLLRVMKGHESNIRSVAFTPDGKHIVSGGDDKTVRLWETATGKEVRVMRGHTKNVLSVAISPDGRTAASAGEDNTIKLWKLRDDAPSP